MQTLLFNIAELYRVKISLRHNKLIVVLGWILLINKGYAMNYDLTEMVRMSSLIVIVAPAHPSTYEKHISFQKEWSQLSDDLKNMTLSNPDIPPYKQLVYRFVIKEVLNGDGKIGDQIDVISSNDSSIQSAHFNYYALGMNMSNDSDHYQPKYKVDEDGKQIVFLRPYYDNKDSQNKDLFNSIENSKPIKLHQFVAGRGREGLEAKSEIERMLKERKLTDTWGTSENSEALIPHPDLGPVEPFDNPFDDPLKK